MPSRSPKSNAGERLTAIDPLHDTHGGGAPETSAQESQNALPSYRSLHDPSSARTAMGAAHLRKTMTAEPLSDEALLAR